MALKKTERHPANNGNKTKSLTMIKPGMDQPKILDKMPYVYENLLSIPTKSRIVLFVK